MSKTCLTAVQFDIYLPVDGREVVGSQSCRTRNRFELKPLFLFFIMISLGLRPFVHPAVHPFSKIWGEMKSKAIVIESNKLSTELRLKFHPENGEVLAHH